MSFTLQLSGAKSVLSADFFPPINLSSDYEIALTGLSTWYSVANVNEENNIFWYDDDKRIILPPGAYELDDIQNYLNITLKNRHKDSVLDENAPKELQENPLLLTGNHQTLRSEIYCRYKIDFQKERNIGSLLGFDNVKLDAFKRYESQNLVNILQVESIRVLCNIVHNSFSNGVATHVLYEFFPDVSPGYKIVQSPSNLVYLPVYGRTIDNIEIRLCDQNNELIDFRGETSIILLHLRRCQ